MSVRLLRGLERVEALARNGMDPFYAAARIARLAGLDAGALAVLYQQKVSGCERARAELAKAKLRGESEERDADQTPGGAATP